MSDILERTLQGLRQALSASPSNGLLWLQVAEILVELDRRNEAEEAARAALEHLDSGPERERALAGGATADEEAPAPEAGGAVLRMVRKRPEPEPGSSLFARLDRERVTSCSTALRAAGRRCWLAPPPGNAMRPS